MTAPRTLTADLLGLEFRDVFGPLGPATSVTGHITAGPRAGDSRIACELARRLHTEHLGMGWGGCGYHFLVADDGTLVCLRPVALQGAHVGGHNGSNVGVLCAGGPGHRPTRAQRETYAWLLGHAHTSALPVEHRTAEDLRDAQRHVHHMWHGHSTNPCAGWFEDMYLAGCDQPAEGTASDPVRPARITAAGYPPPTDVHGIVADGCHVSVLEAHRASAMLDRDARAGYDRDAVVRPRRMRPLGMVLRPAR